MEYRNRKSLRDLLKTGKQLLVPCVYDCLSAKAMEMSGFDAILLSDGAAGYMFGTSSITGTTGRGGMGAAPGGGKFSADEYLRVIENIANTVSIPFIVDAAEGFADTPASVYRNMRRFALAGAAGLTLADGAGYSSEPIPFKGKGGERGPKDLNRLMSPFGLGPDLTDIRGRGYKPALERKEYLERVHAAVMACEGTDCMVIARMECYDTWGFDEVVERVNDARKLGAEMWTVCGGMWWEEEGRMFSEALGGWAMWPDVRSIDRRPNVELDVLMEMGFNLVTFHLAEKGAMYGMEKFGKEIFETKSTASIDDAVIDGITRQQELDILGMDYRQILEMERKFIKGS